MVAPILQHESRPLKKRCFGRSRSLPGPFYFNFFLQRLFARLTKQFPFTLKPREKCFFSDGGLRDHDIIFRDEKDLVFCFLGCVVKFPTRLTANSWRRKARSNPGNWVCIFFSFFPFPPPPPPPPPLLAFFHDQTHTLTQTRKVRRHEERPKGDREQFASLDFWITD